MRGLRSGATFAITTVSVPATVDARRLRREFDSTDFRGYFIVDVPRLDYGDFGFAWDVGLADGYDLTSGVGFFDGFPVGNANVYRRAYQALDQARAGGVGFHLEQVP